MRRRPCAFTIIELLVVITIIGVLAGMLLPAVSYARSMARRTSCQANLRAVGVAVRMYLDMSNDIMPVAAQMPSLKLNKFPRIADVLAPYLPGPEALHCRGDLDRNYFASEGSSYEYSSSLGGRRVSDAFLSRRWGESGTPVMYDYVPFHGPPGQDGSANYLFADGHVGDLK